MRLALVISNLSSGGAQRVLCIMANAWATQGWQITLLTLDDGVEPPFYDLHPAVRYRPLGLSGTSSTPMQGIFNNLQRLWILRQAITQSTPHVVISFMDKPNVLTILATLGLYLPVVVSERIDPAYHPIGTVWDRLRSWVYPRCTRLVVQSPSALSYFSAKVQRRARVIPNPVILPHGRERTPARACRAQAKTVIAMGRLREQKGFDLLLSAFARVAPKRHEWSLVIWGEGALRAHLERLRDEQGLQERVSFPGLTRQSFETMQQADLFVLSSRYEGFPNALCEAMACGLPVISFDCPSGPREIVTDGVNGVLVPPEDVDALAAAMERLMASEEERERLAAQARGVTERFALPRVMGMWEELVAEVTGVSVGPGDRHT
jgi:glycosyltransferase involved in cell wall biosynthesis